MDELELEEDVDVLLDDDVEVAVLVVVDEDVLDTLVDVLVLEVLVEEVLVVEVMLVLEVELDVRVVLDCQGNMDPDCVPGALYHS